MRKLSILALVVILASALSVVGFGVSDESNKTVNVTAKISDSISVKVVDGLNVHFGNGLDPTEEHFAMSATTLEVSSTKNNWEVDHKVSGPSDVLYIGYGSVNGTQNFGALSSTASGNKGTHNVNVNYKLDNLETLGQNNISLTVQFTVSA